MEARKRENKKRNRDDKGKRECRRNQLLSFQSVVTILMYVDSVMYVALLR